MSSEAICGLQKDVISSCPLYPTSRLEFSGRLVDARRLSSDIVSALSSPIVRALMGACIRHYASAGALCGWIVRSCACIALGVFYL